MAELAHSDGWIFAVAFAAFNSGPQGPDALCSLPKESIRLSGIFSARDAFRGVRKDRFQEMMALDT